MLKNCVCLLTVFLKSELTRTRGEWPRITNKYKSANLIRGFAKIRNKIRVHPVRSLFLLKLEMKRMITFVILSR